MFKDKNNPLLDAVNTARQKGDEHRKAVSTVNEHFGVYGRRALPLAKKAEYDVALKKVLAGEKLVSEEMQPLQELSKKTLNSYADKALEDAKTSKGAKADKRFAGLDKAEKKIKKKTLREAIKVALDERVLANKTDDLSPSIEKTDAKKARAKRILNKAKDKKQLDEASKAKLQNYVQKAVASQLEMKGKRKAVEAQPELEKQIRKRGRGINNAKDKLEGPRGPNRSYQTAPDGKMKPTKVFASLKEEVEEDIKTIKEEIAKNLFEKYEAVNETEKQAWVDALDEEQFNILYEFYNPNVKFRQANANPLATIGRGITAAGRAVHSGLKSVLATGGRELADTSQVSSAADDAISVGAAAASGVRSLAGAAADTIAGSRAGNLNAGKPASGIASFAPKPKPTTSAVAAAAAAEKNAVTAPASAAPVAAATAAASAPAAAPASTPAAAAPVAKPVRAKDWPNLNDVNASYSPEEKAKRAAGDGWAAANMDAEQVRKLRAADAAGGSTTAPAAAPSPAAATTASDTAPEAPAAPAPSPAPAAQTDAAAAETKAHSSPRSAPMAPKRSGSWGFGAGSGSDSAGAITNRALGAVNEEFQPRAGLDGWLNKYTPKKKK